MGKTFTKKKLVLRGRASRRRWALKTNPTIKKLKVTLEKQNEPVIASLSAKVKEIQAQSGN